MNKKYAWGAIFLVATACGIILINHLVYAQLAPSSGTVAVGQTETSGGVTEYYTGDGWTSNPPSEWAPAFGYSTSQVEQNAASLPELIQPYNSPAPECAAMSAGASSCIPAVPPGGSVTTNPSNGTYTVTNADGSAEVVNSNGLCISGCGGYTGGSTVNPNAPVNTTVTSCGITGFVVDGNQCAETFPNNGTGCGVCPTGSQCVIPPSTGVGIVVECTAPVVTTQVQSNANTVTGGGNACDNSQISGYDASSAGCGENTTCLLNNGKAECAPETAYNANGSESDYMKAESGLSCQGNSNCGVGLACDGGVCESTVPSGLDCQPGTTAVPAGSGWICDTQYTSCTGTGSCTDGVSGDTGTCDAGQCLPSGCDTPDDLSNYRCNSFQYCDAYGASNPSAACSAPNQWVCNGTTSQCAADSAGTQSCKDANGNEISCWSCNNSSGQGTATYNGQPNSQGCVGAPPNPNDPYGNTLAYYSCTDNTPNPGNGNVCTPKSQYNTGLLGPTTAPTFGASAGSAGSAGGTTAGNTSGGSTATQTGAVSQVNSTLSSAANSWNAILSAASGAATAAGSAGTGAGSAGGSVAGGTATTGSSDCSATAATTISSSLQTLQGLASVLTSSSVSPGVLTSIQNLINAVASVLTALAACIH